jgi:hypothetical protein
MQGGIAKIYSKLRRNLGKRRLTSSALPRWAF